ncbi:hypothetical protein HBB16_13250 [Pseudonocardia sp. MCCB 268]|nr:hypothetical protein [Pseudonocardia cytotoxica]
MKNPNDHGRFTRRPLKLANLAAELNQCTRRVDEAAGRSGRKLARLSPSSTPRSPVFFWPGELPPPSWLMAPMDREWVADCLDESLSAAGCGRSTSATPTLPSHCRTAWVLPRRCRRTALADARLGQRLPGRGRASSAAGPGTARTSPPGGRAPHPHLRRHLLVGGGTPVREGWRQVATRALTLPPSVTLVRSPPGGRATGHPPGSRTTTQRAGGMGDVLDGGAGAVSRIPDRLRAVGVRQPQASGSLGWRSRRVRPSRRPRRLFEVAVPAPSWQASRGSYPLITGGARHGRLHRHSATSTGSAAPVRMGRRDRRRRTVGPGAGRPTSPPMRR